MKKINIILIVIIIISVSFIVGMFFIKRTPNEEIVSINETNITLNDIKTEFLKTDYAQKNKCQVTVSSSNLAINCKKKEYNFLFNGIELNITDTKLDLELLKNLVNSIEYLQGYQENEYLETISKVLNAKSYINGIEYKTTDNSTSFKFVINKKLAKYEEKEIINNDDIKKITDFNYRYASNESTLENIKLYKDSEENKYIFSGFYSGDLNKTITISFYDHSKNVIKKETVAVNDYDNFGNLMLSLVITTRFTLAEFTQVEYYSLNIS